jgi:hypothetical protein
MSIGNRNATVTGVKFLFRVTLRRPDLLAEFYPVRNLRKIPPVMCLRSRTSAGLGHDIAPAGDAVAGLISAIA